MRSFYLLSLVLLVGCERADGPNPDTALTAAPSMLACAKDTDCKGVRICERGTCEAPENPSVIPHQVLSSLTSAVVARPGAVISPAHDRVMIDRFIAEWAKEANGHTYKKATKIIGGDLDNDGVPDVAAVYTIEDIGGGNVFVQNLSVFIRSGGGLTPTDTITVGGVGFQVDGGSIQSNAISFSTLQSGPDDPLCCPSVKGQVKYAISNGKIKLIK